MLASITAALSLGAPVTVAADTTGPVFTTPTYASFVVGAEAEDAGGSGTSFTFGGMGMYFSQAWKATDSDGICGYSVDEVLLFDEIQPLTPYYATNSTTGQINYNNNNNSSSSATLGYNVNARDCAGNVTTHFVQATRPDVVADVGPTLVSGWARTSCVCAMVTRC